MASIEACDMSAVVNYSKAVVERTHPAKKMLLKVELDLRSLLFDDSQYLKNMNKPVAFCRGGPSRLVPSVLRL